MDDSAVLHSTDLYLEETAPYIEASAELDEETKGARKNCFQCLRRGGTKHKGVILILTLNFLVDVSHSCGSGTDFRHNRYEVS